MREYSARKGEGLRFAAATMGVPLADTVAIGDSDNDLTMIEVAGVGIGSARKVAHFGSWPSMAR
ncbi:MAG: hypothetical protein EGP85_13055 [Bifidobacterium bifidum]|nr:hypothetical protein [Bifidobacterium bifidum]